MAATDGLVASWRETGHGDDLFRSVGDRVGWKQRGPWLLWRWYERGDMGPSRLSQHVARVWCAAEVPQQSLRACQWVQLFRLAGYTHSRSVPLVLFRGTCDAYKDGMAWSTEVTRAGFFAGRWVLREGACCWIYRTVIENPAAILCDMTTLDVERNENEVVVDPSLLGPIEEHRLCHPSELRELLGEQGIGDASGATVG